MAQQESGQRPHHRPAPAQASVGDVFGLQQNRAHDLVTACIALAVLQGAANFRLVRVTDGTDSAANNQVLTNCLLLYLKWTTVQQQDRRHDGPGSAADPFKVVVSAPNLAPELFDNIGAGLSGNPLWIAIASAINNGTTAIRGPSQIITATAGAAATTAVASATYTPLAGGNRRRGPR